MNRPTVLAAGGVLWRDDPGEPAVAVVHRPQYDDWSLPKGKAKPGEHLLLTALREMAEETGFSPRIGPYLTTVRYAVTAGGRSATKAVTYWSMRCLAGSFQANREVDEMQWLSLPEAGKRVTSPSDRVVLDTFAGIRRDTEPLLLVRHGDTAAPQRRAKGSAEEQGLSRSGRQQAKALARVLAGLGVTDLLSADQAACAEMLAPYADASGLEVRREAGLTDDGFTGHEREAADGLLRRASAGEAMAVCGRQRVVAGLLSALTGASGRAVPPDPALKKGGWWLLHHDRGSISAHERHEPAA